MECLNDPPCFEGYLEVSREDATFVELDKAALLNAIIQSNRLTQASKERYAVLQLDLFGIKIIREQRLFVYLATESLSAKHIQLIRRAMKSRTEHTAVVLTPTMEDEITINAARENGVLLYALPDANQWDFKLPWLDLADAADPSYLADRHKNGDFLYEEVTVRFATDPGKRHRVLINGYDCRGYSKSDARFARFLYLAACRKADPDVYFGGWVDRDDLLLDSKGKHLGQLRDSLCKTDDCGLDEDDLAALIKTNPEGDGTIRLAIDPANITFDDSIKHVRPLKNIQPSKHKRHTDDLQKSLSTVRLLYKKAVNLIDIS